MASFSANDRLRRAQSARTVRKSSYAAPAHEAWDPDLARQHATAAATRAMLRSRERSSEDSTRSFDRLGGPNTAAVPPRRQASHFRSSRDTASIASAGSSSFHRHSLDSPAGCDEDHLPPIQEFQKLDGRLSPQPSSYRRLRKARSMFSTRNRVPNLRSASLRDSDDIEVVSPEPEPETVRPVKSYGTLRRSMSFLRGGIQPSRSVRHAKSHDAAIRMARNRYTQSFNGQTTDDHARVTSFGVLRPPREHKPFRKTFRTASEPGLHLQKELPTPSRQKGSNAFHGKARSISHSVKNGLKRVFGLSRASGVPAQTKQSSPARSLGFKGISSGVPAARSSAFEKSFFDDGSEDDDFGNRHPALRSIPSAASLCTSQSRVTSWADSTAVNTISARSPTERLSLSAIAEHDNPGAPANPQMFSARTQRVYSALMKKIHSKAPDTADEEIVVGTVKGRYPVPERASSIMSHRSHRTIRQVPSEESLASSRSFATAWAHTPTRMSIASRRSKMRRGTSELLTPASNTSRAQQRSPRRSDFAHSAPSANQRLSTPNDILVEASPRLAVRNALRYVTSSPEDDAASVVVTRAMGSTVTLGSASVYSRTTGGDSPVRPSAHYTSDDDDVHDEEPGMVTIYGSLRTPYASPRRNEASPSPARPVLPSGDWQQWMSSQIARIDQTSPVREHRRENTAVGDDDGVLFSTLAAHMSRTAEVPASTPTVQSDATDLCTTVKRQPARTPSVASPSNFSRPLPRSSSVRTVVPAKEHEEEASHSPCASGSVVAAATPMQVRPSNVVRKPSESPTPKRDVLEELRKRRRSELHRRYSARQATPADHGAHATQLRSPRVDMHGQKPGNENLRNQENLGGSVPSPDRFDGRSAMSSKRMVDMFLNSRRQLMEGEAASGHTDVAEGAFL